MQEDITNNLLNIIKEETSKRLVKEEDLNKRKRLFTMVLYPGSDSYNFEEVMRNIKSYENYAYISHNKDLKENKELKKEHYHIIIKVKNATTIKAISKKTGIPENYIQPVRNERACVRYLVHIDDKDKAQYNLSDMVVSRLYQRFVDTCFKDLEDEPQQISNIYSFISDIPTKVGSYHDALFLLVQYVNSNCYDSIYKRYRYEITDYLRSLY